MPVFRVSLSRLLQFLVQWADGDHWQLRRPSHIRRRQPAGGGRFWHRVQRAPSWPTRCSEKAQSSKWKYPQTRLNTLLIKQITAWNMISFRWTTSPWTSCKCSSTKRSRRWECTCCAPSLVIGLGLSDSQPPRNHYVLSAIKVTVECWKALQQHLERQSVSSPGRANALGF